MEIERTYKEGNINNQRFSLGIGATANCNLNCEHCYSRPLRGESMSLEEFLNIINNKNISSINYGTGENILNPEFPQMVDVVNERGIKQSLTSNGYSILQLSDKQVKKFNDVDISLDFPDPKKQNTFRHGASWNFVNEAIKKCKRLGVEFSITTALMNVNYKGIPSLLERASQEECNLRTNIFKPVPQAGIWKYALDYEQFWEAMNLLFSNGDLISCSEPIINAMLNIPPIVPQSPCGLKSLRIHPNGQVMPCVYWINSEKPIELPDGKTIPKEYWTKGDIYIKDLEDSFKPAFENEAFKRIRTIPDYCKENCDKVGVCGGGCASRRYLNGKLNEPDMYCPIYHKKDIPNIKISKCKEAKDLVHSSYLCTLIFAGKK